MTGRNCETCKNYSQLAEPRIVNEECSVYGFCFKDYMKNGMMSTYPVYIPEGACRDFQKVCGAKKNSNMIIEMQMNITDFLEVQS